MRGLDETRLGNHLREASHAKSSTVVDEDQLAAEQVQKPEDDKGEAATAEHHQLLLAQRQPCSSTSQT
jgi:hypothetical protein